MPLFVFRVKSPCCVVRVTFSVDPPILTVSVSKFTSPVPFGAIVISLFPPPVSSFKTPFPFVLIITGSSFDPPILTVSVSKFTSPLPFGARVILPPAPLVIVIEPVVPFPVFNTTSSFPFDLKTPAADPVPAANSPLIRTVPLLEFVIVSSFCNIIPAALFTVREPSTSVLPLEAVTLNLVSPPLEALAPVPLLITKSPLFNTLNLSDPTPLPPVGAAAAIPVDLEDMAVVHLSPPVPL